MSKKLVTSYTFDASAQTIDAADFTSLEKILLITNVTDQIIIYNFADTTKGGSLTSTTLTLEYDTTTMDDTDKLQIMVEDGTVTIPVTQSGTWDEVGINDSGNSITVDNGGTFAVQAATTIADGADVTLGAKADAKSTATDTTAVSIMSVLKQISASVQAPPSQAVTNAGTFAVQAAATLAAETTKVIGTVNVAASQSIGVTQATAGNLNCTEASAAAIKTAVEALDNSVDGNYLNTNLNYAGTDAATGNGTAAGSLRVSLASDSTGIVSLTTSTASIGKLAANSGVDIGDVTLTAGTAAVGSILPPDTDVTAHTNYARKYYTNAGAVTDGIIWSPAAGKRWHVVTMYIQTSAAATITLEDDKAGGDDPVWKGEIAANSGVTLSFTEHYPMASGEDAADLLITTSAGNVYVTVVGYEI